MLNLFNLFKSKRSLENPSTPLNAPWTGPPTLAGVVVTETTAMTYATVFACVNRIASDLASLKFGAYERLKGGGKRPATYLPVDKLIRHSPDGIRPAYKFWQTAAGHLLRWGNAYIELKRNKATGAVQSMHLLPPDKVMVRLDEDNLIYELTGCRDNYRLLPIDVLHFAGLGYDGIMGYSPIRMAQTSIGIGLSADITMASYFGNSAKPGGWLGHQGKITSQAKSTLREEWEILTAGPTNAGRTAILQEGITWNPLSLPAPDQDFLASRNWQPEEICRWFLMPPTKVQIYDHATYSNLEQSDLDYQSTLIPWANSIIGEMQLKLFRGADADRYFIKPHYAELIKADTEATNSHIATCRQWGLKNVDELRDECFDLNPLPDGQGEVYLTPVNMINGQVNFHNAIDPKADPTAAATTPAAGDPSNPEAVVAPGADVTLNGAQVQSAVQLIEAAAQGTLPRDSAVAMLQAFLGLTAEQANDVMGSIGQGFEPTVPATAEPAPETDEARSATRAVVIDSVGRMYRRESAAVRKASGKPEFRTWLPEFYAEHRQLMRDAIAPALKAHCLVSGSQGDGAKLAQEWVEASEKELTELMDAISSDELPMAVDDLLTRWETRMEKLDI